MEAKKDFVYEMLKWSGCPEKPTRILDCGCGIGGTSRLLAKRFPDAQITGITLSSSQVGKGAVCGPAGECEGNGDRGLSASEQPPRGESASILVSSAQSGGSGGGCASPLGLACGPFTNERRRVDGNSRSG